LPFGRFVSPRKARENVHFLTAAQSVVVELCILHELKKPLLLACEIPQHHKSIWELIQKCKIKAYGKTSLDNMIRFTTPKIRNDLLFVFNQLEESQLQEPIKAAEVPEKAAEVSAEEDIEVDESDSRVQDDAVYSLALKAKIEPSHQGYLDFPLTDPAVKFAVSILYLSISSFAHLQKKNDTNPLIN
jgi:hypothetical protein